MIGRTISHYRIVDKLGAGGMGVVYRAEDSRLGRFVALKFLSDELLKDASALERFRREARSASALNHPNICTIYEVDEVDGTPFLVMELLEGMTLKERLERGPLDNEQLVAVATEFADALATAHVAHIIHRDLKPANLFITRLGHLKILDFGLAKMGSDHREDSSHLATAAKDLTASDTTMGTVSYMSPEQARGDALDARTDLFSFGAVMYEMATGTRAFNGNTTATVYDAILHGNPLPMSGNHQSLQPIVDKALAKDRELRYQSAADIRADLKRLKHDSAPTVRTAAVPRRSRRALGIGLAIAIVAILGSVILWRARAAPKAGSSKLTTIAVLPFANLSGKQENDYLRLAVPDELITILSHSNSLAVRPFAMTRKFNGDVDPQATGRTLNVAQIVTGDVRGVGDRLGLTVEVIDVEANNVLWRESIDVAGNDLIALRNELSNRIRTGLLPKLHATVDTPDPTHPRNDEAYALFLRAAALTTDPGPNHQAVTMLERAVQLDPNYAPAWTALGWRSYNDAQYGGGGREAADRSDAAHIKALSLDPSSTLSSRGLIIQRTERGDLRSAYTAAITLLRRQPNSGDAHFAVGYVDRYGGDVDGAARECETARRLDPTNPSFRSCARVFAHRGEYARAAEYMKTERNSTWSRNVRGQMLLMQGQPEEALRVAGDMSDNGRSQWQVVDAVVHHRPQAEVTALAETARQRTLAINDGEASYFLAEAFAALKLKGPSLDLLRNAIERNYCAYPLLDVVPAFQPFRGDPDFEQLRARGKECRQRFLDWRMQNAP